MVDVSGTESRPLFSRLEVGEGPLTRVRIGQHAADPPVVRVVFDLTSRAAHRVEADEHGLRVIFE